MVSRVSWILSRLLLFYSEVSKVFPGFSRAFIGFDEVSRVLLLIRYTCLLT